MVSPCVPVLCACTCSVAVVGGCCVGTTSLPWYSGSTYNFIKVPTNALEFMDVILLYSNHRRVSTTHVVILMVAGTRINRQL